MIQMKPKKLKIKRQDIYREASTWKQIKQSTAFDRA